MRRSAWETTSPQTVASSFLGWPRVHLLNTGGLPGLSRPRNSSRRFLESIMMLWKKEGATPTKIGKTLFTRTSIVHFLSIPSSTSISMGVSDNTKCRISFKRIRFTRVKSDTARAWILWLLLSNWFPEQGKMRHSGFSTPFLKSHTLWIPSMDFRASISRTSRCWFSIKMFSMNCSRTTFPIYSIISKTRVFLSLCGCPNGLCHAFCIAFHSGSALEYGIISWRTVPNLFSTSASPSCFCLRIKSCH